MKRVMCVYLPAWPLQRLRHEQPGLRDKPVAFYDSGAARGPRVVLYGAPERTRGRGQAGRPAVWPGMPVVEAVAIERRLALCKYDPTGDRHALLHLGQWANRFSPIVALEDEPAPQSLLLDISGCAPLFGGEPALLDLVGRGLRRQGWKARIAIAGTIGAAWALAHYAAACSLASSEETEAVLRPLPVEALRLPADTLHCLHELGIARFGALLDLPRSSVPARLGPAVLHRLDQALGRAPEVLVPCEQPPDFEADFAFEYPTDRLEVLCRALDVLLERIHEKMLRSQRGARRLECRFCHEADEPSLIEVGLAFPSRSTHHMRVLLRTHLERLELPGLVSGIRLCVTAAAPLDDSQADLFDQEQARLGRELSALIDQLSSRLGGVAVTRPRLVADCEPEQACRFEPAVSSQDDTEAAIALSHGYQGGRRHRPVRLYPNPVPIAAVSVVPEGPPVRFRWVGSEHLITRSWGPERIQTGWWRGRDIERDYYVVETTEGARFWIFRRRDDTRWFLHGCFD
jgi:protein ImuB